MAYNWIEEYSKRTVHEWVNIFNEGCTTKEGICAWKNHDIMYVYRSEDVRDYCKGWYTTYSICEHCKSTRNDWIECTNYVASKRLKIKNGTIEERLERIEAFFGRKI